MVRTRALKPYPRLNVPPVPPVPVPVPEPGAGPGGAVVGVVGGGMTGFWAVVGDWLAVD
jgi:hypothetical protein